MPFINRPLSVRRGTATLPAAQRVASALLVLAALAAFSPARAADADHGTPIPTYKVDPAPSADLTYAITATPMGIKLKGTGLVSWRRQDGKYSVKATSVSPLFGKFLEASSEGAINGAGLAPDDFVETRFRKQPATATFDRQAGKIHFTQSDQSYPIRGGEQDRTSVIWQLIGVARAAPKKFKTGSTWNFFVVGPRDAEPWIFEVENQEKIDTPQGQQDAFHVVRKLPEGSKSQQLDIWIAPALDWYPVKLRFSDGGDDNVEQSLQQVVKKAQ